MRLIYRALSLIILITVGQSAFSQAIPVEVKEENGHFQLYRGGEPYYIQGAGGRTEIETLIECGGNSIRTWGLDEADEALRIAEENDLTVMLGFWVQHERHGFDYNDEEAVQKQLNQFRSAVLKYKDHPNLLLWGIGNEVDLFYTNPKVWDAIQDIAKMVHELDPHHPTTTVTAGLDSMEVQYVMDRAPDIDIYGINTYGDIAKISQDLFRFGWEGPYIVSEWGPNGHWEVPKTDWGAPIEQSSTEKAATYWKRFKNYIYDERQYCIGSYVFLWGQKQETTSTWYGLFTTEGKPTETLDEVYRAWRGEATPNPAPSVNDMYITGFKDNINAKLERGGTYSAVLDKTIPEGDKASVTWMIYPESNNTKAGGDFESALQPELGLFKSRNDNTCTFKAPRQEGAYRLFVYIENKDKKTAYMNVPFFVSPASGDQQNQFVRVKKRALKVEDN